MLSADQSTLEVRAFAFWAKRRLLPRPAVKILFAATERLSLSAVAALARLREHHGHTAMLFAENRRLRLEMAELRSQNDLLRTRIDRIPPRHRRHYSPEARFQILEHMRRFLLSVEETAARFLVTSQTLYNWLRELDRNPEAQTIGRLLRTPPLTRYANVVRRLVRQMKDSGFGGDRLLAAYLARSGWTPSRRSVGRFRKERMLTPEPPPIHHGPSRPTTVYGRYPNHLWLADISRIPTVFPFLQLHLTVVFDAFSRLPLKAAISYLEPSAAAVLGLLRKAVALHGRPRHFVSDQGAQFTAGVFSIALAELGIRQRFGALYEHGSIALIERFFLTLKTDLQLEVRRPWNLADLERRLLPAFVRYSYCRPHSALEGRVPIEAFYRIQGQRPCGDLAPRGRPGDPDVVCPFEILFLDPYSQAFPILVTKAA